MTLPLWTWHAKSFTDVRRRERGCAVGPRVDIQCLLTVQRYTVVRLAVGVLTDDARIALTRPPLVTRSHVSLFQVRRAQTKHWIVALRLFTVRAALLVGAAGVTRLTASQLRFKRVFVRCIHRWIVYSIVIIIY